MKRNLQVAGLMLAMVVTLAACSSSKSSTSTTKPASATTAAPVTTSAPVTTAAPTTSTTAKGPSITITPDTGLANNQVVDITGTGYPPGEQLGVTECANKGAQTAAGDCNLGAIKITTATAAGTVSYHFAAALGPFGQNNIVCTNAPGCLISVAQAGSANPNAVATQLIKFSS